MGQFIIDYIVALISDFGHGRYLFARPGFSLLTNFIFSGKGELAISSEMEQIQTALFFDNVPDTWTRLAYPSIYSLGQW